MSLFLFYFLATKLPTVDYIAQFSLALCGLRGTVLTLRMTPLVHFSAGSSMLKYKCTPRGRDSETPHQKAWWRKCLLKLFSKWQFKLQIEKKGKPPTKGDPLSGKVLALWEIPLADLMVWCHALPFETTVEEIYAKVLMAWWHSHLASIRIAYFSSLALTVQGWRMPSSRCQSIWNLLGKIFVNNDGDTSSCLPTWPGSETPKRYLQHTRVSVRISLWTIGSHELWLSQWINKL